MKCNHIKWTLMLDGKAVMCDECGLICGLTLNIVEANKEPIEECKHEWICDQLLSYPPQAGPLYCKKCRVLKPVEEKKVYPRCNGTGECIEPVMQGFGNEACDEPTATMCECQKEEPEWVKGIEQEFPELQKLMAKGEYQFLIEHFKEQLNKFVEDIIAEHHNTDYRTLPPAISAVKEKWGI